MSTASIPVFGAAFADAALKAGDVLYARTRYEWGKELRVDDESGWVHRVRDTAANVADFTQVDRLLHGAEKVVCADAGYIGVEKRSEHERCQIIWPIAGRRSTYKKHRKRSLLYRMKRKIEKAKAQVRAKVAHPFRVIKRQFGYVIHRRVARECSGLLIPDTDLGENLRRERGV